MTGVNEPGLFSLILGSRKPEAQEFKRWVTHEVVPTIRKTGSYSVNPQAEPLDINQIMGKMVELMEKMNARLEKLEGRGPIAIAEKSELVEPEVEVVEYSYRMIVRDVINKYLNSHPGEYSHAWRHLYNHFLKRYHMANS